MHLKSNTLLAGLASAAGITTAIGHPDHSSIPYNTVLLSPKSFVVIGPNAPFREDAFTSVFNPTNTTPPFFQAFHPDFFSILGHKPSIHVIASDDNAPFAHEGPVWVPNTDEVYFTSNTGLDVQMNNFVSKLSVKQAITAIAAVGSSRAKINVNVTKLSLPDSIQMAAGGTGPFKSSLLMVTFGRGNLPSSLALVNHASPHNVTILLDNFFGRQFNSLDDVKIHPRTGKIFFTDTPYGFLSNLRPEPLLPSQVYSFDTATGLVRVAADGFSIPNGIAFTRDGRTAYVGDSGSDAVIFGLNQTRPSTIYAFDVHPKNQVFTNRRVFAYTDAGIPDGLQLDTKGNLYAGCGDGVQVWNSEGTLLGKFFLGTVSSNFVFAGKGRLVILAETNIFLAQIAAEGIDLSF